MKVRFTFVDHIGHQWAMMPCGPALWYGPEKGWEPLQVKKDDR